MTRQIVIVSSARVFKKVGGEQSRSLAKSSDVLQRGAVVTIGETVEMEYDHCIQRFVPVTQEIGEETLSGFLLADDDLDFLETDDMI